MKRIITILLVTLLSASLSFAQTHIPAGDVSGTWTFAGSPYIIDGEITIPSDSTLSVEPGVIVQFSDHFKLIVYGRLIADGNADSLITFTAEDTLTGWFGLRFFNTNTNGQDASLLSYCILEYGKATGTASSGGAIYLENSDEDFEDVTICNNEALGFGGGIYMINSNPNLTDVSIYNNTAVYDGGGIFCYSSIPTLIRITINHNTTEWYGGGIACFNNSDLDLVNVTISKNIADYGGCGVACLYNSDVTLLNSIIWDNGLNEIYIEASGSMNTTYSDIKDGTGQSYFGEGCIDADPIFVNPAIGDFNLTAYSPCIDAGDPDPIYNDPDGTRNDMGAHHFQQAGLLGTVTFAPGVTGNVEEVEISITGDTILTVYPNVNGIYFVNVSAGTYTVKATLEGYYANPIQYDDVVVNPGELVSGLDFEMDEIHPGNVKGIVSLNGDGLDPEIVNVEISADGIDPVYPYLVLNLYYEYDYELAPGIYDITAHLAGYLDSTHDSVVVQPMQTISGYDFDLQPITYEGHISGTVTLKNGPGNVEDVEVSVPGFDPVHPDSNGVYTLTIVNGTYDVTAFLEGYTQVTIPDVIVLPDQTTIGIDMTLLNWDIIDGTLFIMIVYATVTYDGTFLSQTESNQLGAFGPGGVSDCRGIAVWQEGNHPLWCTDYHYWSLPGYWYFSIVSNNNSGTEIISFKVYNTETDSIYDCYETIIFEDCTDDNSIDFELLAPQTEQVFNLMEGWNWTSLNIIPTEAFIDSAFAPLGNNIYQIKSQYQSTTFLNGVWIGDLTHLTKGDAYLIYMIDAFDDFEISGSKINPIIYPIPLNPAGFGWNWIAYYPQVALSLEEALVSIEGNATVIKTQTQSAVYSDGIWQGDLLLIEPQVGYKIKIDNTLTEIVYLTYPGATTTKSIPLFVETMDSYANSAGWEIISGTKSNMIILAELIINNEIINNNYIAGVFDKNGNCRSIGRWENGFWYFTVVGNEDNEELHFRVYETENGILYESNEKITFINDSMIGKPENPIMITLKESTEDVLLTFDLRQNYPNPISNNLTSTISYSLPVSGYVHLAIYNIKGQLIETLVNNFKEPGDYSLKWDISKLNSGIYFYKLTFGDNKIIKRCLIMK